MFDNGRIDSISLEDNTAENTPAGSEKYNSTEVIDQCCVGLVNYLTKLVIVALLIAVIIGICIGNSLVILSVTLFVKMRTLSNVLIGSLASADLLVAIFVLPISLQVSWNEWQTS